MTVRTFCRIADPFGVPLLTVAGFFVLDYIMNCAPGAVGVLELTVSPAIDTNLLFRDGRITVHRSIDGAPPYMDNNAVYLIETVEYTTKQTFIRAFHVNTLTARRYITYPSGSTFANKVAAPADNMLKAYWRENAGTLIAGSREGTQTGANLNTYVTTDPDYSKGPNVQMVGAHDPLDSVLKRICDASNTAGTYLTYEILSNGATTFVFRTYTTQRGYDRRNTSVAPMILSEQRGNLRNAKLTTDYHDIASAAIAKGQGQNSDILIATALDTTLINASPFGRIERVIDMPNMVDTTTLGYGAGSLLRDARPLVTIAGTLEDTRGSTRGINYDLGDMLSVAIPLSNDLIDVRLDLIHEHYDASSSSPGQSLTSHQVSHRYANAGLRSV